MLYNYGNIYYKYTPMLVYIPYMDPMGILKYSVMNPTRPAEYHCQTQAMTQLKPKARIFFEDAQGFWSLSFEALDILTGE